MLWMWLCLDPHLFGYAIMPLKLVAIRRGKRLPNRATIITALTKDIQNATAEGNSLFIIDDSAFHGCDLNDQVPS